MTVIGVATVILIVSLWAPIYALFVASPGKPLSVQELAPRDDPLEQQVARINGRSLFFVPAEPPPAPPPQIARDDEQPSAPPPPSRYAGPSLIAMINGAAWFSDGTKLAPSDEADDDLRVVRLEPPWEAIVEWKGVEFTVSLFKRDQIVLPNREPAAAAESPDQPLALSAPPVDADDTEDQQ